MRGSVAFRPLLLSSSTLRHGGSRRVTGRAGRRGPAARIAHHIEVANAWPTSPHRRHDRLLTCSCLARIAVARRRHRAAAAASRCNRRTACSASSRPTGSRSCRATSSPRSRSALVKPGMSRPQVRDVLGTPLLTDVFHADRWDYVFTIRRQGAEPQRAAIVVLLRRRRAEEHRDGDDLPSEREFVASIDTAQAPRKVPTLELSDEQRQGAAGAGAPAAAAQRGARSAPARELPAARSAALMTRSADDRRTAPCASPSPAPPAAWATC